MNLELLTKIISETDPTIDVSNINMNSKLSTDLHIDSLGMMDLLLNIEEKTGVKIEDEKVNSLKTISDLIKAHSDTKL